MGQYRNNIVSWLKYRDNIVSWLKYRDNIVSVPNPCKLITSRKPWSYDQNVERLPYISSNFNLSLANLHIVHF